MKCFSANILLNSGSMLLVPILKIDSKCLSAMADLYIVLMYFNLKNVCSNK